MSGRPDPVEVGLFAFLAFLPGIIAGAVVWSYERTGPSFETGVLVAVLMLSIVFVVVAIVEVAR